MSRDSGVPFVLWLCAAIVAHLVYGAGAGGVAMVFEDLADVRLFAEGVRGQVAQSGRAVEVTLEEMPPLAPKEAEEEPAEPEQAVAKPPDPPPEPRPAPEEVPTPDPPSEQEQPKSPVVILPVPAPAKPPPPVQPPKDERIAVKQHVKDKNQQDNPNARFIGDEANRVEEESVARITSHDQDNAEPTPGGQHSGSGQQPGNAEQTRIADSEDREGDPDKAPGEHTAESKEGAEDQPPAPPAVPKGPEPARPAATEPPGGGRPGPTAAPAPVPAAPTQPPDTAADRPDPITAEKGSYSLDPRRKSKPRPAPSATASTPLPRVRPGDLGLGAGPNKNGVRTSLSHADVVPIVGVEALRRHRAAEGQRRRSEHRGSWHASSFERWRPAIENYVSSVRPGNQTALNTARVPFATYLVSIHNRLHPVFADNFLSSLDKLPFDHPLNDYKLIAALEIVVDPTQGRIVKLGVTKTSGFTTFDIGALDSVHRAQPFGQAPSAIVSADGNVYLHWEFHRNPIYACSTMNARPYILNTPPVHQPTSPPERQPNPPADPRERGVPPGGSGDRTRFGLWKPLSACGCG